MKIKACCLGTDVKPRIAGILSSTWFAQEVLTKVIGEALGVEDVLERPAEYYVQSADTGPAGKTGVMGVEVRLTGASRSGRTPKQFHAAILALDKVVKAAVVQELQGDEKCQVFCMIMIDGQIETQKGTGDYGNQVESKAVWVSREHPEGTE